MLVLLYLLDSRIVQHVKLRQREPAPEEQRETVRNLCTNRKNAPAQKLKSLGSSSAVDLT